MSSNKQVGCGNCYGNKPYASNDLNVVKTTACNINGQEIVVLVVSDDIGPCCTDNWAFYPPNYQFPKRPPCKFNSCCKPCWGSKY